MQGTLTDSFNTTIKLLKSRVGNSWLAKLFRCLMHATCVCQLSLFVAHLLSKTITLSHCTATVITTQHKLWDAIKVT